MVSLYKGLVTSDVVSKFVHSINDCQEVIFSDDVVEFSRRHIFTNVVNSIREITFMLSKDRSNSCV